MKITVEKVGITALAAVITTAAVTAVVLSIDPLCEAVMALLRWVN